MSTVNCMRALGVKVKELDENTLIVKVMVFMDFKNRKV